MYRDSTSAGARGRPLPLFVATLLLGLLACGDATEPRSNPPPIPGVAVVSVAPDSLQLSVGDLVALRAVVRSAKGDTLTGQAISWESADTTKASVSPSGSVHAKSPGSVDVWARVGTKAGRTRLTITAAPEPTAPSILAFSPSEAAVGGAGFTLEVRGSGFQPDARVYWNGELRPTSFLSSERVAASIGANDLAQIGSAQIRVVNAGQGAISAPIAFPVVEQTNPVRHIALRPALAMTLVASPVLLSATVLDTSGAPLPGRLITYSSSNQLVATVDGSGRVTPVGEGEVTITARSEGKEATSAIAVYRGATYHLVASNGEALVSLDMRLGTPPASFWRHWPGSRTVDPSPSPDGRYIAYSILDVAGAQIAILDRATRTYQFLDGSGLADQPAWSPNGDRIAFRRVENARTHIWTVNSDGSGAVRLTDDLPPNASASDPAWSPDGRKIVFAVRSSSGFNGLQTMNADGTGKRVLTSGALDGEPSWHGDAVAFTRSEPLGGMTQIWRVSVSGVGPLLRLSDNGAHSPAWSPDGRWIAYVEGLTTGPGALMAMRPFGEEKRPISLPSDGPAGGGVSPAWVVHR